MMTTPRFARSRAHAARGFVLAAAAAIALAGCATQPERASASIAPNALQTEQNRAYTGRFAVQYQDQLGNPRNVYGNFDWQEQDASVSLELRSPLGQTLAVVKSAPSGASLELPNRQPQYAPDVGELMQRALGFALPLDGLRYWLLPTPAPATPATTVRDPQDGTRIKEIRQDGWTIDYIAYADAPAAGVKRINLVRQTPPLDIKLVLDR
ncbi:MULTISPECIES: lipoprotein insertase outer membrane protein LolB [Burkholderia]|uniref:lipoprotein insertase outer membrane protein LolB n=1 Tax=Burkholderia TaxID=32008 RepID=UPI00075BB5C6|nr:MULTISPECIES: lipoprotein insertase outer membrane protein LolB [Burkholderia]AOJ70039.1 outer membrane lipoprotein LolB [Burkholderia savannae]KVG43969.1 outer membrane lipoprotein LolB [Burkholderia sp. MSMB0265]KVG83869.1 outer membrane lipoprotein LolB [Burkholderia sp. MSMB2040]KVG94903.1 outer membrane lipoprotein LolB [Burkholderia sp. MSMB2041]KVH00619.1 outer membrane lipoprotein LolB [Burkholderia sp. MSMB2042]